MRHYLCKLWPPRDPAGAHGVGILELTHPEQPRSFTPRLVARP